MSQLRRLRLLIQCQSRRRFNNSPPFLVTISGSLAREKLLRRLDSRWRSISDIAFNVILPRDRKYPSRKLDIRKRIFFSFSFLASYRRAILPGTNMPANVNDWYFLALRREMKPHSNRRPYPVNFPVKFTVQRVPENVADWRRALCGENICHCFFNVFHSPRLCVRARRRSHTLPRACSRGAHTTTYPMTTERTRSLAAGFISIVFQANKREHSHLLPSPCQDSKSPLNYGWISRGVAMRRWDLAPVTGFSILQAIGSFFANEIRRFCSKPAVIRAKLSRFASKTVGSKVSNVEVTTFLIVSATSSYVWWVARRLVARALVGTKIFKVDE